MAIPTSVLKRLSLDSSSSDRELHLLFQGILFEGLKRYKLDSGDAGRVVVVPILSLAHSARLRG